MPPRLICCRGFGDCSTPGMRTELEPLYQMIEKTDTAMMTTRRPDGHLQSRAMANQKHAAGADLWFVTSKGTAKLRDLELDPHLNLGYYDNRTREGFRSPASPGPRAIARRSRRSTRRTGASGFPRKATTRATAPRTMRASC